MFREVEAVLRRETVRVRPERELRIEISDLLRSAERIPRRGVVLLERNDVESERDERLADVVLGRVIRLEVPYVRHGRSSHQTTLTVVSQRGPPSYGTA